ncbi:uncharacterized protein LOC120334446 [Styela clava]
MKGLVIVSAISNVCGIIAAVLICTAFFTGSWLNVHKIPETAELDGNAEDEAVSIQKVEFSHGLWDNGLRDLNCIATPFGICMYTRAGLFAGIVLLVPGILFNILATAIVGSGGRIETSGTMARAGGIVLTLADIGTFIGVLLFTLQHTVCITSCSPEFTFYPSYPDDLTFGWSFLLAWIGLAFLIATTVLMYVFSCMVENMYKVSFSPNRMNSLSRSVEVQPDGVSIELVRMNENALDKEMSPNNTTERDNRRV